MDKNGVYILQSLKNGRYYIGSTGDLSERLFSHNNGLVKATKNTRPFLVKTFIPCADLTDAKRAEHRLKSYKRRDILEKIIKDGLFPWEYNLPG